MNDRFEESTAFPDQGSSDVRAADQDNLRSMIVSPNSRLRLEQCGLPKQLALDLFKPKLLARLIENSHVETVEEAARAIRYPWSPVWDELTDLMRSHSILLFFPSKLSRTAVQAFEPRLAEEPTIQIHPSIAQQLGIDFSGQTAFARLPQTQGGQSDALSLLRSAQSLTSERDGKVKPWIPKDAMLGIRYLTVDAQEQTESNQTGGASLPLIGSIAELDMALEAGRVRLHDKVRMRLPLGKRIANSNSLSNSIVTTAGRQLFNERLPAELPFYNETIRFREWTHIIQTITSMFGRDATIQIVEDLSRLGWDTLRRSGLSIALTDLKISTNIDGHCAEAHKQVDRLARLHKKGLISAEELHASTIDRWFTARDRTFEDAAKGLDSPLNRRSLLALGQGIVSAGSFGSICGMVGSMSWQREKPIVTANYRDGLRVIEYFPTCLKRLDPKLPISDSQKSKRKRRSFQIARKLSDAMRDSYISMHDCGTAEGIDKVNVNEGSSERIRINHLERIVGRVASQRIVAPRNGKILLDRNQLITKEIAGSLDGEKIDRIKVRSPLTCQAPEGICQLCYGIQPSTGVLPKIGERVGSQAALAIGEVATEIGESIWIGPDNPWIIKEPPRFEPRDAGIYNRGRIRFDETQCAVNRQGQQVVLSQHFKLSVCDDDGQILEQIDVPYGAILNVKNDELCQSYRTLAEGEPGVYKLFAKCSGRLRWKNLSVEDWGGEELSNPIVVHKTRPSRMPTVEIIDSHGTPRQETLLYAGTRLFFKAGSEVKVGDVLAEWHPPLRRKDPLESSFKVPLHEWAASISHLECLLDLSVPSTEAVMAEYDGELLATQSRKGISLKLNSVDRCNSTEHWIPHRKSLFNFYAGPWRQAVSAGELISRGMPSWHDTLRVLGPEFFWEKWLAEMLLMLHMNRLQVAEQHLELALRRMTSLCKIADSGDTTLSQGTILRRAELARVNAALSEDARPAQGEIIAVGLLRSLRQRREAR